MFSVKNLEWELLLLLVGYVMICVCGNDVVI